MPSTSLHCIFVTSLGILREVFPLEGWFPVVGFGASVGKVIGLAALVGLMQTGESVTGRVGDGAVGVHAHVDVSTGFVLMVAPT